MNDDIVKKQLHLIKIYSNCDTYSNTDIRFVVQGRQLNLTKQKSSFDTNFSNQGVLWTPNLSNLEFPMKIKETRI